MRDGQIVGDVRPPKFVSLLSIAIQKFWIQLFGGLVPGNLFLFGASFSLIPAIYLIFCFVSGVIPTSLMKFGGNFFDAIKNTPPAIWIPVFGIIVTLAYVVGHLFFRRDPQGSDQHSLKLQSQKSEFPTKDIRDRVERIREELVCSEQVEIASLYPGGKEDIGLSGLCQICSLMLSKDGPHKHNKSKNFINLLKLHIKYHFPQKYRRIILNEAQIQLSSSLWYVSHTLRVFSIIGFASVLITVLIIHGFKFDKGYLSYISFIMPQIFVFLASEYMRIRIEKSLHAQRLCEVITILETATSALSESPRYIRSSFSKADQAKIETG